MYGKGWRYFPFLNGKTNNMEMHFFCALSKFVLYISFCPLFFFCCYMRSTTVSLHRFQIVLKANVLWDPFSCRIYSSQFFSFVFFFERHILPSILILTTAPIHFPSSVLFVSLFRSRQKFMCRINYISLMMIGRKKNKNKKKSSLPNEFTVFSKFSEIQKSLQCCW